MLAVDSFVAFARLPLYTGIRSPFSRWSSGRGNRGAMSCHHPQFSIASRSWPPFRPNPAGVPLSPEVRRKLDEKRKEINPNQFAPNDPRRPEQAQPADWAGIIRLAQESLAETSKDLLLAARLTEALVKEHGFGGLRDGLPDAALVEDCWDRVHPEIQDGDLEVRASAFNWLDDEIKAARFPNTVRTVPLTNGAEGQQYGFQQWKDAQESRGQVTQEMFERRLLPHAQLLPDSRRRHCPECRRTYRADAVLTQKMGEAAPGLSQVRQSLADCQELAQFILKRKGPATGAGPEVAAPANGSVPPAPPPPVAVLTRDDVLNRLADESALLLQMEPHSPVAYLMQRAVKLARLPLPELMRVLVRDQNVLGQLDRDLDLGLDKQDAAKQETAKPGKK